MSRSSFTYCLRWVQRAAPGSGATVVATSTLLCILPTLNVALVAAAVNYVGHATASRHPDDARAAMNWVFALVGVMTIGHLLSVLNSRSLGVVQLKVENAASQDIAARIAEAELAELESASFQDDLALARQGSQIRIFTLFTAVNETMTGACSLALLSLLMVSWDPVVGICILVSPVPAVIANAAYGRIGWTLNHELAERRRKSDYLLSLVSTSPNAAEVIAQNAGPALKKRYLAWKHQILSADLRIHNRRTASSGILGLLSVLGMGFAFYSATRATLQSGNIGTFAGFLTAATTVQGVAQGLYRSVTRLFEDSLYVRNVGTFLNAPAAGAETSPTCRRPERGIVFEDVSFSYPGSVDLTLSRVNFELRDGETLYVVGENGSGKSSVAKLACGLYYPSSGDVRIDGFSTSALSGRERAERVATIFQNPVRYEGSIAENIWFGREEDADTADIPSLLAVVGLANRFPDRDTNRVILGKLFSGGQQLSGGEWQRLALARAITSPGTLLVADEPDSFLDGEGVSSLTGLLLGGGTFSARLIITHEVADIPGDANVLVLENGSCVEYGKCAELAAYGGLFSRLSAERTGSPGP